MPLHADKSVVFVHLFMLFDTTMSSCMIASVAFMYKPAHTDNGLIREQSLYTGEAIAKKRKSILAQTNHSMLD